MRKRTIILLGLVCPLAFIGCATSLRPYQTQPVNVHFETQTAQALKELPKPEQKIVAAVYGFRDQTGQYQPSKGISYSTAVTQGATSILIEALEKSGWFIPIARASISNLLNERRIIRSTRRQNNDATKLEPLLFAGILLEGGIIAYSSNVVTGGAGVRFLGMGSSGQFRKDKVTIYLRAVSTQTGRILKSVRTTKAIISKKIHAGVFRYVATNRLLEAEIGITYNEPSVTAVTAAINAALRKLILQGIKEGLWQPASKQALRTYKSSHQFATVPDDANTYIDVYGLTHHPDLREGFVITANFSYGSSINNYPHEIQGIGFLVQVEKFFSPTFSVKLSYQRTAIGAVRVFSTPINNFDLMLNAYLTPDFKLSPYLSVGGGVALYDEIIYGKQPAYTSSSVFPTISAAVGLDYRITELIGIRAGVNYRYFLSGKVDGVTVGSINDQQWNIITGISLSL